MDYRTRSRSELLKLCKERGLSGAGTNEDLIERLEAQDAAQPAADDDFDPLADEDASAEAEGEPDADQPAAEEAPAVEEPAPAAEPQPMTDGEEQPAAEQPAGQDGPDPAVKEGVTGNVYRREFYPDRLLDDAYHRHLIAETHHAANAAGHATRGGLTIGHRVRYDQDAAGKQTVVYEVYLARQRDEGRRR
jgi:hypothetical protein